MPIWPVIPGTGGQPAQNVYGPKGYGPNVEPGANNQAMQGFQADVPSKAQDPQMYAKNHIIAMQNFLRKRGYDITPDGVRGPQTEAAILAFHNHVNPQKFNTKYGTTTKAKPTKASSGPVTAKKPPIDSKGAGSGVNATGANTASPGDTTNTTNAATPTSTSEATAVATLMKALGISAINPTKTAAAMANEEYNPQIAALNLLINQQKGQGTQDLNDIANWFAQVNASAKSNITSNANGYDNAINAYNQEVGNTGTGSLFGGSINNTSDAVTANDADFNGLMQANKSSQGAFDNNLQAILKAQGVEQSNAQKQKDNQTLASLAQQLVSLKGAKGQAQVADLATAQQNATQQASALQSLALAQQLAPAQIQQAIANANAATANATTAGIQATNAKQMAAANLKLLNANVKKAMVSANGQQWNLANPTDRGQLTAALRQGLQTAGGTFRVNPTTAWQNLQQALVQAGLANNPQAQQLAKSLMQETFNTSHAKHMWGGFSWGYGKVLKTGKHFDAKSHKLVPDTGTPK